MTTPDHFAAHLGALLGGHALATTPWRIEPEDLDLTAGERTLLFDILVGRYDGYSVIYSETGRRSPTQKTMRALASLGVIEFTDAAAGGWERGMWAARVTCVGANAAARHDGPVYLDGAGGERIRLDSHPGCSGGWLPDGTCTGCRRLRPLDAVAYRDYLTALAKTDADAHAEQVKGPRLYCVEHGRMRRDHITTTKVCLLPGTVMHDGSLFRL